VIDTFDFRDTFVMAPPYIYRMKSILFAGALLTIATLGFSQSMMQSATKAGGTGSMMSSNTMTADPKVGAELRAAMSTGHKVMYTTLEAAEALAAKAPTVLFFAADWCPYCQADFREINANGSRLGATTIVVVDYDKERELERTYGVTVQDTFVQIDAKGGKLSAWNGGGVDGIIAHVKSM
jgi:thiol-disulfide isomerase/thioredoxin